MKRTRVVLFCLLFAICFGLSDALFKGYVYDTLCNESNYNLTVSYSNDTLYTNLIGSKEYSLTSWPSSAFQVRMNGGTPYSLKYSNIPLTQSLNFYINDAISRLRVVFLPSSTLDLASMDVQTTCTNSTCVPKRVCNYGFIAPFELDYTTDQSAYHYRPYIYGNGSLLTNSIALLFNQENVSYAQNYDSTPTLGYWYPFDIYVCNGVPTFQYINRFTTTQYSIAYSSLICSSVPITGHLYYANGTQLIGTSIQFIDTSNQFLPLLVELHSSSAFSTTLKAATYTATVIYSGATYSWTTAITYTANSTYDFIIGSSSPKRVTASAVSLSASVTSSTTSTGTTNSATDPSVTTSKSTSTSTSTIDIATTSSTSTSTSTSTTDASTTTSSTSTVITDSATVPFTTSSTTTYSSTSTSSSTSSTSYTPTSSTSSTTTSTTDASITTSGTSASTTSSLSTSTTEATTTSSTSTSLSPTTSSSSTSSTSYRPTSSTSSTTTTTNVPTSAVSSTLSTSSTTYEPTSSSSVSSTSTSYLPTSTTSATTTTSSTSTSDSSITTSNIATTISSTSTSDVSSTTSTSTSDIGTIGSTTSSTMLVATTTSDITSSSSTTSSLTDSTTIDSTTSIILPTTTGTDIHREIYFSINNGTTRSLHFLSATLTITFPPTPDTYASLEIASPSSSSTYQDPSEGPWDFRSLSFFITLIHSDYKVQPLFPISVSISGIDFNQYDDLYYFDGKEWEQTLNACPGLSGNFTENSFFTYICHTTQFALFREIPEKRENLPNPGKIAGIALGSILGATVIGAGVFLYAKWRRGRHGDKTISDLEMNMESVPEVKNVKIKEKLGEGHFGDVFRGIWKGAEVAMKKLRSEQDYDDFSKECLVL